MRILGFLVILLSLINCKTVKKPSELTKEDIKIQMTRGACFGPCPIYTITVYEGGYAALNARNFTEREGNYHKQLSKKEYNTLVEAFESAPFSSLLEEYPSEIVDLAKITLKYRGKDGHLKVSRGSDPRPKEHMLLQNKMEALYASKDWIKDTDTTLMEEVRRPPVDVLTEDKVLEDKIIIKPREGVRLPVWFKEMDSYGIRLVKRVSESQNLWLITYDQNKTKPAEMLRIIKAHKDIEMAEFDKVIVNRGM